MREEMATEFFTHLGSGGSLRIRFSVQRGEISHFVVQLEIYAHDEWLPIVRYDSAHGRPHRDILDARGETIRKDWLDDELGRAVSMAEGFEYGRRDLKAHWERYRDAFLEGQQ